MDALPPLSTSALNALTNGFAKLDSAASEIVSAGQSPPDALQPNTVDLRSGIAGTDSDPVLAGIRDLMLAKIQVRAGAALLHAYRDNRQDLFEMLRP